MERAVTVAGRVTFVLEWVVVKRPPVGRTQ